MNNIKYPHVVVYPWIVVGQSESDDVSVHFTDIKGHKLMPNYHIHISFIGIHFLFYAGWQQLCNFITLMECNFLSFFLAVEKNDVLIVLTMVKI